MQDKVACNISPMVQFFLDLTTAQALLSYYGTGLPFVLYLHLHSTLYLDAYIVIQMIHISNINLPLPICNFGDSKWFLSIFNNQGVLFSCISSNTFLLFVYLSLIYLLVLLIGTCKPWWMRLSSITFIH